MDPNATTGQAPVVDPNQAPAAPMGMPEPTSTPPAGPAPMPGGMPEPTPPAPEPGVEAPGAPAPTV